jgi:hypothetical protein
MQARLRNGTSFRSLPHPSATRTHYGWLCKRRHARLCVVSALLWSVECTRVITATFIILLPPTTSSRSVSPMPLVSVARPTIAWSVCRRHGVCFFVCAARFCACIRVPCLFTEFVPTVVFVGRSCTLPYACCRSRDETRVLHIRVCMYRFMV